MGWEQAANVLWAVKQARAEEPASAEEEAKFKQPILDKYKEESSPYYSTVRLWDEGIFDPAETRTALGLVISVSLNAPIPEDGYGTFRM
tara:strand:+ start:286 stop:552 length:267 start_codon:yes stop_codon:yes gene_type:complete